MSSDLQANFTTIVKAIGTKKPLVTLLGPGGKTPACAALVFGMGGKLTRAVNADAAELAAVSQALLVDLDQLNPDTGNAITKALTAAKAKATPVVLVVTGAELVPGRRAMALALLGKKQVVIVRGNYNECASLIGADKLPAGATADELAQLAQNLAGVAAEADCGKARRSSDDAVRLARSGGVGQVQAAGPCEWRAGAAHGAADHEGGEDWLGLQGDRFAGPPAGAHCPGGALSGDGQGGGLKPEYCPPQCGAEAQAQAQ